MRIQSSYNLGVRNTIKSYKQSHWKQVTPRWLQKPVLLLLTVMASFFQRQHAHTVVQVWNVSGEEASISVNYRGEICNFWFEGRLTHNQVRSIFDALHKCEIASSEPLSFQTIGSSPLVRLASKFGIVEKLSEKKIHGTKVGLYKLSEIQRQKL